MPASLYVTQKLERPWPQCAAVSDEGGTSRSLAWSLANTLTPWVRHVVAVDTGSGLDSD